MSKYFIQGESVEAIADEVRELSGTTELMGLTAIVSNVGEANSEINIQAELLAQIISALDGKAAGGSGGVAQPACVATVKEGSDVMMESAVNIAMDVEVEVVGFLGKNDYQVVAVDGATYGFALNDNGYYESQNKGVNNSYAICKVLFNAEADSAVKIDCINYGEAAWDYGLISELDTMLSLSNTADTSGVLKNFKGSSSASVVSITAMVPSGEHFICIKFIKDSSGNSGKDSLQFIIGN